MSTKGPANDRKRPRAWLWLLLLIPLALGFARLRFDIEILNLLPAKLPVAEGLKVYQRNFSNARELIITVEAATPEEAANAARSLAQILRAKTELVIDVTWQPGWLESPAEATELLAFLWLNQPPALFGELTNRLAPPKLPAVLAETREHLATSFSPGDLAARSYDPYGFMQLPASVAGAAPAMGTGDELFASKEGNFR
ncbi:MAG TPA: hypothetical protein VHH73_10770, partial [Verrucomicrobiae bacterium]|nr:hypothetical protein [Verrucomicrobiae bacterium]